MSKKNRIRHIHIALDESEFQQLDELQKQLNMTQKDVLVQAMNAMPFLSTHAEMPFVFLPKIEMAWLYAQLSTSAQLEYTDFVYEEVAKFGGLANCGHATDIMSHNWYRVLESWSKVNGGDLKFSEPGLITWHHGICKNFSNVLSAVIIKFLALEHYEVVWKDIEDLHIALKVIQK